MQIFWTQNFQICLKTFHLFSVLTTGFNTMAHHHISVDELQEFLDQQYPDRWIGHGGPRNWPARSPDLNSLHFFFWGHVKNVVYSIIQGSRREKPNINYLTSIVIKRHYHCQWTTHTQFHHGFFHNAFHSGDGRNSWHGVSSRVNFNSLI
jgi:hypothetical protein